MVKMYYVVCVDLRMYVAGDTHYVMITEFYPNMFAMKSDAEFLAARAKDDWPEHTFEVREVELKI